MQLSNERKDRQKAARIVCDAGGKIVGRTRLQKVGYLLECAGLGDGFRFEYRHYGPFCEELAAGIRMARAFGLVLEDEKSTDWGGFYSIYEATEKAGPRDVGKRARFAEAAATISAIELELLATAVYLQKEGSSDPWGDTKRRKPGKAAARRLSNAKKSYKKLLKLSTPEPLPSLG